MRSAFVLCALVLVSAAACGPKPAAKTAADEKGFDPDAKSGPDAKRSNARDLPLNTARTDEVSYLGQDKTDWYTVNLAGKPGVMKTVLHWDNDSSDVMIDVYDEVGRNISNSPVRDGKAKEKQLLTQIDKPGVYYVRVTAPTKTDGTVYTIEVKWDAPPPVVAQPQPPALAVTPKPEPEETPKPKHHHEHEGHEPKAAAPSGESIQGRILQAFIENGSLTLYLDKGSAQGVHTGQSGTVLAGATEDPLEGGSFRITEVAGPGKSVARCALRSLGKNNRVSINLGK